jgi:hypothetical protein
MAGSSVLVVVIYNEHEHAFGLSYGSDKSSFKVAYTRESTSLGFKVKLGN